MLFTYTQQTQRLIGDVNQAEVPFNDIVYYVNQARRHVAELTQCVRVLTPISNSISSITTLTGGTGYTSPTVTISTPDSPGGTATNPGGLQATAIAVLTGTTITSITTTGHGSGYFQPQVTITDPTGTGATAKAVVAPLMQVAANQEVYSFTNAVLNMPGVSSIIAVKSVSMLFNDLRYSLPVYSFSVYQAYIRKYPFQYYFIPTVGSQYGRGANGSLYLYPVASQAYAMEWDCFCLPSDLTSDTDVDLIPLPWSDAVPFYAAFLATLPKDQNKARGFLDTFDQILNRQSRSSQPGRATNITGRWSLLFPFLFALCAGAVYG